MPCSFFIYFYFLRLLPSFNDLKEEEEKENVDTIQIESKEVKKRLHCLKKKKKENNREKQKAM